MKTDVDCIPKSELRLADRLPFLRRRLWRPAVEPTLMVIGLNHRTAPVAVRERFWISESRMLEALQELVQAEGVEEVIVLATCNRTEFLLWASDPGLAANSVLRLLSSQ